MNELKAIDLVDKLMLCYRNKIQPCDEDIICAYEMGINVKALELYVKEVELGEQEIDEEHEWFH